jgi:hypothetical protein
MKKLSRYGFSRDKLFFNLFLLYITTTVFTPKVDLGSITFYLFEPYLIFLASYMLLTKKIVLSTQIEKSYFIFVGLSLLSYPIGVFNTGLVDEKALFLIIKYAAFGFIIPISYYFARFVNQENINYILFTQFLFVLVFSGYVIFNTIYYPQPFEEIMWGYSQEYRLIGYTGYALGLEGLRMVGTTSVPVGVFIALLFLIYLSLYINLRRQKYLYMAAILLVGELLTHSRSGLLVLFIGVLYVFVENYRNKNVLKIISLSMSSLILVFFYFGLYDTFSSFGTIGKLFHTFDFQDGSSQTRLLYLRSAMNYVADNPIAIIIGTGYGGEFSEALIGTYFLESLIFNVFFQSGIAAFFVVNSIFFFMWYYAKNYSNRLHHGFYSSILYGIKLFIPGFFLANAVGGNSLQTDFIVPFLFFAIGTTIRKLKSE